jgi:hypothetical protein
MNMNPLTSENGQYYRSWMQGRIEKAKEREDKKAASRRKYVTKMNKRKRRRLNPQEALLEQ